MCRNLAKITLTHQIKKLWIQMVKMTNSSKAEIVCRLTWTGTMDRKLLNIARNKNESKISRISDLVNTLVQSV